MGRGRRPQSSGPATQARRLRCPRSFVVATHLTDRARTEGTEINGVDKTWRSAFAARNTAGPAPRREVIAATTPRAGGRSRPHNASGHRRSPLLIGAVPQRISRHSRGPSAVRASTRTMMSPLAAAIAAFQARGRIRLLFSTTSTSANARRSTVSRRSIRHQPPPPHI